jgi:hypothetical protein
MAIRHSTTGPLRARGFIRRGCRLLARYAFHSIYMVVLNARSWLLLLPSDHRSSNDGYLHEALGNVLAEDYVSASRATVCLSPQSVPYRPIFHWKDSADGVVASGSPLPDIIYPIVLVYHQTQPRRDCSSTIRIIDFTRLATLVL